MNVKTKREKSVQKPNNRTFNGKNSNLLCNYCKKEERMRPYDPLCPECFSIYEEMTERRIPVLAWISEKAERDLQKLLRIIPEKKEESDRLNKEAEEKAFAEVQKNNGKGTDLDQWKENLAEATRRIRGETGAFRVYRDKQRLEGTLVFVAGVMNRALNGNSNSAGQKAGLKLASPPEE